MTQKEYREELYDLLNRATETVDAIGLVNPLIDSASTIIVLAAEDRRVSLEGMLETLRHRLDLSVVEAQVTYGFR